MLCGDAGCLQPAGDEGEAAGLDPACAATDELGILAWRLLDKGDPMVGEGGGLHP